MQNGVHYFYWDWDLYKPFDYEPVSVYNHNNGKTVLSRFHWQIATIWTEPIDGLDNPAVEFTDFIHTPIVKSRSYDYQYMEIDALSLLERIDIVNLYIPIFDMVLKKSSFKKKGRSYQKILQEGGVPRKYLFELSKIKASIVIGKLPGREEVPESLRKRIWPD